MTETEFVFVYSTFPDAAAAEQVAETLIRARLAACANIYPMRSVYEWEGKIEHSNEVGIFIKTRRSLAQAVIEMARKTHPYALPCFLVLPIDAGNPDYLTWIRNQTKV